MTQDSGNPQTSESLNMASKMPNVFKIGCGQLAGARVSFYGLSALKAHLHVCAEHVAEAVEMAAPAGLTAQLRPADMALEPRYCGDGWDTEHDDPVQVPGVDRDCEPDWREQLAAILACRNAMTPAAELAEEAALRADIRAYMGRAAE